ncbi:MAG: kinase/pyrophosphorylase [Rhodospirillaceae bacterium]|nr:kinase/pyrophosphorylase [Rhodospirillaceae bacterium]
MTEIPFNLHLVSDSSGETVSGIARACLVQYDDETITEHFWWLVRTKGQMSRVIDGINASPGLVIFTLLDPAIRGPLEQACRDLGIPCVSALDPVMDALEKVFDKQGGHEIGRQHTLDDEYFDRIEAMHYAMAHDDGQNLEGLKDADIVLVGVSRTSKTPTCMYLANRGFRAGNIPLVPGIVLPDDVVAATNPLFVGLTREPKSLTDIRQSRLRLMNEDRSMDYADVALVREEVSASRRLFRKHGWPVIDVTRKSIEETAASIIQLYNERHAS